MADDTCRCVGSYCTCDGSPILKDGARARIPFWAGDRIALPLMFKDGSISGEKHTAADAMLSDSDRAYAEMKARDANAWRGGEAPAITPQKIVDGGPEYARGIQDGAYEAMKERDRNAWRGR
ncbi:hypothetical protein D3218_19065 [Aureimonas flava]|uniref:Uncharacterized protein n=1 Tax=Aureimonas flava TaxID=2320271 RepID=A0A3A1WE51_9HYPH|nr:hypothetical protein [Aureimonas flava]RIX97164.1 hypothetical protein D3218_19065 [Aureimonas flava]